MKKQYRIIGIILLEVVLMALLIFKIIPIMSLDFIYLVCFCGWISIMFGILMRLPYFDKFKKVEY
jgi:hypothetical protein